MSPLRSSLLLILGICLALLVPSFLRAQAADPVTAGQAPIPGSGHHYMGLGSETVNPPDGSLSFDLPLSPPAGRQLSFPFGIRYGSPELWYLSGQSTPVLKWYAPPQPLGQNGWSYKLAAYTAQAFIKASAPAQAGQGYPPGTTLYCLGSRNYVFRGSDGVERALGLGGVWPDPTLPLCTGASTSIGSSNLHGFSASAAAIQGDTMPALTVVDPSGTTYSFATGPSIDHYSATGPWAMGIQTITDKNGNQISLNGNSYKDTLGRTPVSWSGVGSSSGDQITISGLSSNIVVHWANVSRTFPETGHMVAGAGNCSISPGQTATSSEVSEIDLPNGQKYTFAYESTYGRVSSITFPGAGYVRYVWGLNPSSAVTVNVFPDPNSNNGGVLVCYVAFDTPAVTDRYVSYDGATEVLHQHFTYSTTWAANNPPTSYAYQWATKTTTVTSTDLVTSQVTKTIYNYTSVPADVEGINDVSWLVPQVPVEQSVVYQDGSNQTLKTVNKTWLNAFAMIGEQTILDNGQGITSLRCYDSNEQVTHLYEYGFQSEGAKPADPSCASSTGLNVSAIGPLRRHTQTVYHNFLGATPSTHIVNEPDTITVYDGSGNQVKQTTFTYTETVSSSGAQTGLVPPPALRGNVSTITRWLNTGGSSPVTSYTYFDTGQVATMTDACDNTACSDMSGTNHATSYLYTDNFASGTGTPPGQTKAYLTQTTYPQTNGVNHIEKFTWGYNDGQKRTSVDQNNLTVSYQYNDPLIRPTQINYPDTGQAPISYNDSLRTVTTSRTINATQTATTVKVADGLGHIKQTQLTTDPQGTVYTDTTYDGFGRVRTVSNPYRLGTDPTTTSGTTTYLYDALGRKVTEVPPGGTTWANNISTQYSGNCTVVTDPSLRARKSCADSLGRLIEVDEPSAPLSITNPTPGTGTVTINGSERDNTFDPCQPHSSCPQAIPDTGYVSVTVNGQTATTTYGLPDTAASVAASLANAVNGSSLPVTATANGSLVTLTAKTGGASTNYSLSTTCATTNSQFYSGCSFSGTASGSALTGGTNGNPAPLNFPNPYVTLYTYDLLNNLLTVTQKGGTTDTTKWRARTFTYDSLSRLLTSNNPEVGTITYTYDANGNVATKKDARNITTTYMHDTLNRETSRTYSNSDPTVTTVYDGTNCLGLSPCHNVGHRTSMTDAAGSEVWAYQVDSTNKRSAHVEQRTTNSITKTSTYYLDLAGNVYQAVYPTGRVVNYTYDNANRPKSATDGSNGITYATDFQTAPTGCLSGAVCYTPQGTFYALSIGQASGFTGLNLTHTYNNRLQPLEFKASSSGGNAIDITYSFADPANTYNAGHVFSITNNLDATRSQTFSYDQLNRITSALTTSTHATSPSHCWGENYSLDAWSNLTSIAQTGNSNYTGCVGESGFTATADGNNHLTNFSYDASGNTLNDGTYAYAWDGESQLKSANGVNYTYDGDGRRVSKSNGKLYWYGSGGDILAETNTTGATTAEYIFFAGKRIAMIPAVANPTYYIEDLLGTSRVLTTNAGVVCYDADFYPYGGERAYTNTCPQNCKFEGKERDTETGNDDFGARYYSNRYGRWLSADWSNVPVAVPYANLTNPQTLNLYSMVADDPESFADLDGHEYCSNFAGNSASGIPCGADPPISSEMSEGEARFESYVTQAIQAAQEKKDTKKDDNKDQTPQDPKQPQKTSEASLGVLALPFLARAGVGALEGAEGGAAAGTAEPGGGNVVGALIGATAGAVTAALAPTVYSKSKDEAKKAWTKFHTAVAHYEKLMSSPHQDPRSSWKQTIRRIANDMERHAGNMTGHQGTASAIRFAAQILRTLVANDPAL